MLIPARRHEAPIPQAGLTATAMPRHGVPIQAPMRQIWLHPHRTLMHIACTPGWSWATPLAFGLLSLYLKVALLALVQPSAFGQALLTGLSSLFLSWPLTALLLWLAGYSCGRRVSFYPLLTLCAWATVPFVVRNITQAIYMLLGGDGVQAPGLAGLLEGVSTLLSADEPRWVLSLATAALGWVDLYNLWHIGLLLLIWHTLTAQGRRQHLLHEEVPRLDAGATIVIVNANALTKIQSRSDGGRRD